MPSLSLCSCILYFLCVHASNFTGLFYLTKRQIPRHACHILFLALDGDGDKFIVEDQPNEEGSIIISCTSLCACSYGLYTYAIL